jgi:TatA/E family protein of Tat protein translocase
MSVGPMEIIIVLALALLIFGPKRLPEMGRTLGRAAREFRKATDEVKGVFDIGLNDDDDAKKTPGAAVAAAAAPLETPALEPWWNGTVAAADAPAPAASRPAAETVPGLAGFLGVAQAAPVAEAPAAGGDGSAAPAFASFLGTSAGTGAGDPPAPETAPETSAAPGGAESLEPGAGSDAPVAPEAPAAAEAG